MLPVLAACSSFKSQEPVPLAAEPEMPEETVEPAEQIQSIIEAPAPGTEPQTPAETPASATESETPAELPVPSVQQQTPTSATQTENASSSGSQASSREYAKTLYGYTEGVDTKCIITGYTPYSGKNTPYFLKDGDKVAVISPSELPSRELTDITIAGLRGWGFVPVEGKYVCPKTRTLEQQMEDLEWALTDPEIKAIFCVRGGYGATDVMDIMSLDLIKNANKPIIGYSDVTVYHSAWTACGLPSIHGCMSMSFVNLPQVCREAEIQMMKGNIPSYKCVTNKKNVSGVASGVLIGGNLSTITAIVGTAYDCTQIGKPYILFLEDVHEDFAHIHRSLKTLKNLGVLDNAEAIIFGEWVDISLSGDSFGPTRGGNFKSVADMIHREFLDDLDIPVAFDFPAGHGSVHYPLLMGEEVRVSITESIYSIEWK